MKRGRITEDGSLFTVGPGERITVEEPFFTANTKELTVLGLLSRGLTLEEVAIKIKKTPDYIRILIAERLKRKKALLELKV